MSYTDELAKLTRIKIDLIEIIADTCSNTYGSAPCTAAGASGSECYNTFATCQDKTNFTKTTKSCKFINANLPLSIVNDYYFCKPYIKSLGDLPTEIKETDTVVKRLKAEFYDELDNDVNIDPYFATRPSVQGTFWKKWLARNPNYKGRLIKQYEGFEGMSLVDFQLKFVGKIENIEITTSGIVIIEAADLMKELSKIEYPLKQDITNVAEIPMQHTASSETGMLSLDAYLGDICKRTDRVDITGETAAGTTAFGGTLTSGTYTYKIAAMGIYGRLLAVSSEISASVNTGIGENAVSLSWDAVPGTVTYRVYFNYPNFDEYIEEASEAYIDKTYAGDTNGPFPTNFEHFYVLNGDDPSNIANWDETTDPFTIELTDTSTLNASGYVQIDDEIIYYDSLNGNFLDGVIREQVGTKSDRHEADTTVFALLWYSAADNPFTILQDILAKAGIDGAYIDSNFGTLEAAWSGINFWTLPIAKNKLNEIYFDLVNAVNCMSWVGEDGKVKILEHDYTAGSIAKLTDEANFIGDSITVDLNEESRYTRWLLYWNRVKADGSITEEDNYSRLTIAVDAVAENENEYGDKVENVQTSTWLNLSNDTEADVITYVNNLLAARKDRTRDAQTIIEAEVELKDTTIVTGDKVDITTSKLQDSNGNNFTDVRFRVIRKELLGNKVKLKMIKIL